jgi:LuxR family transcriptional regulator, maltose regulon positive regulatory protein
MPGRGERIKARDSRENGVTTIDEPIADQGDVVALHQLSHRRASGAAVVSRPGLWKRLETAARVTVLSAPPGSGKTVLVRSWISEADQAERTAWVQVGRDEHDPQRFWLLMLGALRQTTEGPALVRGVTAAPDLDGWAITERLLQDLAQLEQRLWLVVDDLHELCSEQALRQLELLIMRAPEELRFVLATRHDVRLGLHQLRLEGELTEIRADDLRFSEAEARALFKAASVELAAPTLGQLLDRTEGWAAGLRLAALSLAGHPDPERFAADFSGSERTVADYLLAEVLDRQPAEVRRLLLRTSVLEWVNGKLADLLTGGSGAERMLQDLEEANAFVVSLDAARSRFRYHQLFADLLQLELRRTEPAQVTRLHARAAEWFAGHGFPVEAICHAQAAQDWRLAARLLTDHWPGMYLDGQAATIHALVARFPAGVYLADAELAALVAADELACGSLEVAERYLGVTEREAASVPAGRRGQALVLLAVVRLLVARQRGDPSAVAEQAQRLQAAAEAPDAAQPGLGEELRALALINLGITEFWAGQLEGQRHLERGATLARCMKRPYPEFIALAYQAEIELFGSFTRAGKYGRQAIELAEQHGWTDELAAACAYAAVGAELTWRGQLEDAEPWIQRAERTARPEADPAAALVICHLRGVLELGRGRAGDALAAFRAAERLAGHLAAPHLVIPSTRALMPYALAQAGETELAEHALASLGDPDREPYEVRVVTAALRLIEHDPQAAAAALGPILDGAAPRLRVSWLIQAFLLEAKARDALGDPDAAGKAIERALDLAEPDGLILMFLLHPVPGLLERRARQRTAHAALIAEILDQLAGRGPTASAGPSSVLDPLSNSELRVLRYLPTHLSAREIARELSVSTSTVKTHLSSLYVKLGAHRRAEAIERARALGLLAPPARSRGRSHDQ